MQEEVISGTVKRRINVQEHQEKLWSGMNPNMYKYSTQDDALRYRNSHMNRTGVLIAQDKHTMRKENSSKEVVVRFEDAHNLMAKKEYFATDMASIYRDWNSRSPDYRNYYELATLYDPVFPYVDFDVDIGEGKFFKTAEDFLAVEYETFIKPFEEFLATKLGLDAEKDIVTIVMDSTKKGVKVSRHYVWKTRGKMFFNNKHFGHFIREFEVYLMTRPGGKLPHDRTNPWYKINDKRPYPQFLIDYIYTKHRVYRSLGSCKFGSRRTLLLSEPGVLVTQEFVGLITKQDFFNTSIFYPSHFYDDAEQAASAMIDVIQWRFVPEETVIGAPKLIRHWPYRAFHGNEKISSDTWFQAATVVTGDSALAKIIHAPPDKVGIKPISEHLGRNAKGIRFVIDFLNALINNPACDFAPSSIVFMPTTMAVRVQTTNRYCPAREAETNGAVKVHTNNKTSVTVYLKNMTVFWHCFNTQHSASDKQEFLDAPLRMTEEAQEYWQMDANEFIEEHRQKHCFDATVVFRAALKGE